MGKSGEETNAPLNEEIVLPESTSASYDEPLGG